MPAPKGNKYALGLTTNGRNPIYETPEDMEKKIQGYFDSLFDEDGDLMERPKMTGLALFLGFCSRQSMYDYAKKEDFSYIIKRAQTIIEMEYESMLDSKSSTGAIFALKNMGWKDSQSIEMPQLSKINGITFDE